jgi:hypothetical protein
MFSHLVERYFTVLYSQFFLQLDEIELAMHYNCIENFQHIDRDLSPTFASFTGLVRYARFDWIYERLKHLDVIREHYLEGVWSF